MIKQLLIGLTVFSTQAFAGEDDKDYSLNVTLNTDAFFGFAPFISGGYRVSEDVDFNFYTIKWAAGTFAGFGNWTEYGVGATYRFTDSLSLNGQVGLLNGDLVSNSTVRRAGDGVVPNLTLVYNDDSLFSELYVGYYMGLQGDREGTRNYLHAWYTGGYKFSDFFTLGLHYEQLSYIKGETGPTIATENFDHYAAVGPYVQFSNPKGGSFVRFAHGADIRSDDARAKAIANGGNQIGQTFWKVTVGFSI